jgi:hypothetical protein
MPNVNISFNPEDEGPNSPAYSAALSEHAAGYAQSVPEGSGGMTGNSGGAPYSAAGKVPAPDGPIEDSASNVSAAPPAPIEYAAGYAQSIPEGSGGMTSTKEPASVKAPQWFDALPYDKPLQDSPGNSAVAKMVLGAVAGGAAGSEFGPPGIVVGAAVGAIWGGATVAIGEASGHPHIAALATGAVTGIVSSEAAAAGGVVMEAGKEGLKEAGKDFAVEGAEKLVAPKEEEFEPSPTDPPDASVPDATTLYQSLSYSSPAGELPFAPATVPSEPTGSGGYMGDSDGAPYSGINTQLSLGANSTASSDASVDILKWDQQSSSGSDSGRIQMQPDIHGPNDNSFGIFSALPEGIAQDASGTIYSLDTHGHIAPLNMSAVNDPSGMVQFDPAHDPSGMVQFDPAHDVQGAMMGHDPHASPSLHHQDSAANHSGGIDVHQMQQHPAMSYDPSHDVHGINSFDPGHH